MFYPHQIFSYGVMHALLIVTLFSACVPRATLAPAPPGVDLPVRDVFVASTRDLDVQTGQLGTGRSETLHLLRYGVTLPEGRALGDLPFPTGTPNPETDMLIANGSHLRTLVDPVNKALRGAVEPEVLLFVHGYNNRPADGVLRVAQMAADFQFDGVAAHYAWPSAGRPLGYAFDRDSALFARDGLEETLAQLAQTQAESVVLVAHSLGTALTMEALRSLAVAGRRDVLGRIGGVVLISPDIDVDVFRAQARRIGTLPQPFIIFTSERDRALRFSARLTGQTARVGTLRDPNRLSDLDVTLIDVSALSGGDRLGHFTPATSPLAIRILRNLSTVDDSLRDTAPADILSGTVIQVRQATRIVVSPF